MCSSCMGITLVDKHYCVVGDKQPDEDHETLSQRERSTVVPSEGSSWGKSPSVAEKC